MGHVLDELRHVRERIGYPENQDKEELKEKLKQYIKREILPFVKLIDNGYDHELKFPKYKVWELLHYPYILEVLEELEKEIEIHYLVLAISQDSLCSMIWKDLLKKYRSPK